MEAGQGVRGLVVKLDLETQLQEAREVNTHRRTRNPYYLSAPPMLP